MAVTNSNISFMKAVGAGKTVVSTATQLHGGSLTQVRSRQTYLQEVWQAELKEKESGRLIAIVNSTAANIGLVYVFIADFLAPRVVDKEQEEKEKMKYFAENKTKFSFAFNVEKMTKEEISKRFDKHAPHWYLLSNIL